MFKGDKAQFLLDLKDGEVILSANKNITPSEEPDSVIEEWLDM